MKFRKLSEYLSRLEQTASRNEMTVILADLFRITESSEIDKVCYLLQGGIEASYKQIVFSLAEKHMVSILARVGKLEIEEVNRLYKSAGDLGDVAEKMESKQNLDVTVEEVYESLANIAKDNGEGSVERKIAETSNLLQKLDSLSGKYVVRILLGRLRLGFSDLTMIDALSWMEKGDKSLKGRIEKAYRVIPDIGLLAKEIKEKGLEKAVKDAKPILGIPVSPMLAQRLKSPEEMIKKMGTVAVEPKFDGLRVLIHFNRKNKKVFAYTRNLKNITESLPELSKIGESLNAQSVILDSEAVGVAVDRLKLLDFQTTMQRRRKHEIEEIGSKIPLQFQVFDIMFKDGKSLMDETYIARREILKNTVKNGNLLNSDEFVVTDDPQVIVDRHLQFRGKGLEGIVVKKADSQYVPGRTGWRWVKMKEAEAASGKLSDTVDCVVMGFTSGRGKRVAFGVGQFLVGIREGESIKTVTKVGTGLTDEQFRELKKRLSGLVVEEKPKEYDVHKNLVPDFWVTPELVVEIAGDDITKSPNHTAGYAIRFPRLVNFRDDKGVEDITTVKEFKQLFELQKN